MSAHHHRPRISTVSSSFPTLPFAAFSSELLLLIFSHLSNNHVSSCARICKGKIANAANIALYTSPVVTVDKLFRFYTSYMLDPHRLNAIQYLIIYQPPEPPDDDDPERPDHDIRHLFEYYSFEYGIMPMVLQPLLPRLRSLSLPWSPLSIRTAMIEILVLGKQLQELDVSPWWDGVLTSSSNPLLDWMPVFRQSPLRKLDLHQFQYPDAEAVSTIDFSNLRHLTSLAISGGLFDFDLRVVRTMFNLENLRYLFLGAQRDIPFMKQLRIVALCKNLKGLHLAQIIEREFPPEDPNEYPFEAEKCELLGRVDDLGVDGAYLTPQILNAITKPKWRMLRMYYELYSIDTQMSLIRLVIRRMNAAPDAKFVLELPDNTFSPGSAARSSFDALANEYGFAIKYEYTPDEDQHDQD